MNREYDSVKESVHQPAVIILDAQTRLDQELLLVTSRTSRLREGFPAYRSPAQSVFPYGLVLQASASEILICNSLSIRGSKTLLKEFSSEFRHKEQALMPLPFGYILGRFLLLDDFYVVFLCQIFKSLSIGKMLMFHHEAYSRT